MARPTKRPAGAGIGAVLALFLYAAPAGASPLQDAVPDCRRGPRIYRACELDCYSEATTARAYELGSWRLKLGQCRNVCKAMLKALDECRAPRRRGWEQ